MSEPKTREQFYWAKLGGQDVELPAPKTRTQEFMKNAAERLAEAGGGLPDPSPYADGTVLIKVGNEWKAQEGYGWSEELEKAIVPEEFAEYGYSYCRVADVPELPDGFGIGSDVTYWLWGGDEDSGSYSIDYAENGVFSEDVEESPYFYIATEDGASAVIGGEAQITFPRSGLYFLHILFDGNISYTSGFAFGSDVSEKLISWDGNPGDVHTIDSKFIPNSASNELLVTFIDNDENIIADKGLSEIVSALSSGKVITGRYNGTILDYMGEDFFRFFLNAANDMAVIELYCVGEDWDSKEYAKRTRHYTLTPAE